MLSFKNYHRFSSHLAISVFIHSIINKRSTSLKPKADSFQLIEKSFFGRFFGVNNLLTNKNKTQIVFYKSRV